MSLKNLSARTKIPKLLENKLKNKKIIQIYKKFERSLNINKRFAVAVSGGPDSLALAFLSKIYSIKKKISTKFLIVDHKLRPESTKEAKLVKKALNQFYIKSEILTWRGKKPLKNIQSLARKKRYELLFNACRKFKIDDILLGHHLDDLFENFFIRLIRGSGLRGLISLDTKTEVSNKNLLRPLLNQSKKDLKFLSKKVFGFYIEDPSNKDEKYLRIKIRKLIIDFEKNGLNKVKLNKSIKNLKYADEVVRFYVNQNLENNSYFSVKKKQIIFNHNFFLQPYEIVFRAFSESIKLIGQKYYLARGKKIDKILHYIKKNRTFRQTLGGCIIEKVNQTVVIKEER